MLKRHHRGRFQRPGFPEAVGVLLMLFVLLSLIPLSRAHFAPSWAETSGQIIDCQIENTHYNATSDVRKVSVQYKYTIGQDTLFDSWTGVWPDVESPNALPASRIEELKQPNRVITVLYNPEYPSQSRLHYPLTPNPSLYAFFTLVLAFFMVYYFVRIYPAWRRR